MKELNKINKIIILAGGIGSRMGEIGDFLPKFLLPVGDHTLLFRLLSQLKFQFDDLVISTNSHNFPVLTKYIKKYFSEFNIKIVENKYHAKSAVSALYHILKRLQWQGQFLLILSDIFYLDLPLSKIGSGFTQESDVLFGTKYKNPIELTRGGIIVTNNHRKVIDIVKKPSKKIKDGARWSGMAICNQGFWKDLSKSICRKNESQIDLEEIFQYRILSGHAASFIDCGEFVNINSPQHLLLANLLSMKEKIGKTNSSLTQVINDTKNNILYDKKNQL